MSGNKNNIDMVNGPLWGKILKFASFFMMTAILQHLYSAADVIVVGRYAGEAALAGVGTCTALVSLFSNFIIGLSTGTTIVLGQALGAKNKEGISKTVHTAIAAAICGGFIITLVCTIFTKQLLNLIDVPKDVLGEASVYLRIMALGYIPSLIYNFSAGMLRAKGDTKRALYTISVSGIINVLLNLFFVCVLKMGAGGVATATTITHIFNAIVMLYILCHEPDETKITLRKIRIHKEPFTKILKFGIPSGIQSTTYSVSNMVVQSTVNGFGAAAIAGGAATTSITDFYNLMQSSMYQSSIVFTSQNYGAKKYSRIKKIMIVCATYVLAFWALQCIVTIFFGKTLLGLYAPGKAEVIKYGWMKLSIVGFSYGLIGFLNIMNGVLRGMGQSLGNMIVSIVSVCGTRILWVTTAAKAIGTFKSIFVCYPLSFAVTTLLLSILLKCYMKEKNISFSDNENVTENI